MRYFTNPINKGYSVEGTLHIISFSKGELTGNSVASEWTLKMAFLYIPVKLNGATVKN